MFHKLQELEDNKVETLHLKSNILVVSFCSHSIQGTEVDNEGVIKFFEALKSNTSLTSLNLSCNRLSCFIILTLNTDCNIGNEGVIKLAEALKSNTSLTELKLGSNRLVASFHSHSIQFLVFMMKKQSNYLKCSNQIHLSGYLISDVRDL
jgi:hypothetical protein